MAMFGYKISQMNQENTRRIALFINIFTEDRPTLLLLEHLQLFNFIIL